MTTETKTYRCDCGEMFGSPCEWIGPATELLVVEYIPKSIRATHEAAGNRGLWPHNGSSRLAVQRDCAARIDGDDAEWSRIVEGADPARYAEEIRSRSIRISDGDQIVAFGLLRGSQIECGADLGDDVYGAIEDAILQNRETAEVNGTTYAWWIDD